MVVLLHFRLFIGPATISWLDVCQPTTTELLHASFAFKFKTKITWSPKSSWQTNQRLHGRLPQSHNALGEPTGMTAHPECHGRMAKKKQQNVLKTHCRSDCREAQTLPLFSLPAQWTSKEAFKTAQDRNYMGHWMIWFWNNSPFVLTTSSNRKGRARPSSPKMTLEPGEWAC